jgi:hypothetical protein
VGHVCADGWVCEFHPDQPFPHCDGAGAPCPVCNATADPRFDMSLASTKRREGLASYRHDDGIQSLGNLWAAAKDAYRLSCDLTTHPLGWELRLQVGQNLVRSQVCRTQTDVFNIADEWKREAKGKGWT